MAEVGVCRKGEVDFPGLLEKFRRELRGEAGAIGCFVGIVRKTSKEGETVECLCYECSEETKEKLQEIASGIEKSPNISGVAIYHVVDELKPGEDVVYVLVAGKNRAEVFEVLPKIMNRVKTEVPIWKKEVTKTKEYWIHEIDDLSGKRDELPTS